MFVRIKMRKRKSPIIYCKVLPNDFLMSYSKVQEWEKIAFEAILVINSYLRSTLLTGKLSLEWCLLSCTIHLSLSACWWKLKRELCNTLQWNGIIPPSLNFSLLDCWKKQDSLFFSLFTPVFNSCMCHCWIFSHTDPHFLSGVSVAMTKCRRLTYENA